jgi:hypothetical protein
MYAELAAAAWRDPRTLSVQVQLSQQQLQLLPAAAVLWRQTPAALLLR